ncbi:4-hydroxybenzoate polyprenyltransferase [Frigoribacterium sp. PvP120]|uniref:prenyltransferase n=1 Tax=unclassified Frigoribacterium TaxID=2627005 RepID=UPI001AE5A407|nr:prenyltransferase [Frigoribacterium sp. PvP121]MBP1240529.1 4-hydroxybenzoate polyprenyltransferase [Frigoribacterium sp. PvP121]
MIATLRALAWSSRPLSWINTAFPFAAAYLLSAASGSTPDGGTSYDFTAVPWLVAIVGTVYFLVPYNLAMYGINDVFDYESDLRNPRKGGVEGALLDRSMHRPTLIAALVTNVPFLVFLVAVGSPLSWLVLAVSVFAVVAYSAPRLRFKERPVVDSVTSSTHFVSPAVYGLVLAGADPTPALCALLAAFFLWGTASHAFGAVQDVIADREGGIASIATVFGARTTVRLSVVAYLLSALLMTFTDTPGPFAALIPVAYAISCAPWWNVADADAEGVNRGWKRFLTLNFVSGFVVTMLLIWWVALG